MKARTRQLLTVARLELRRAFFSRRALWVYLLALFPAVIFFGHALQVQLTQKSYTARGVTPAAVLDSIRKGEVAELVMARVGKPIADTNWRRRRGGKTVYWRSLRYFDGTRQVDLSFKNGVLESVRARALANLETDRSVFAGVFQIYYIRLAVFFGCLGIFMNLFRGKMMDKTLHFWLLAPMRRDVLLGGKYLAGLLAASVIFTTGAVLCFGLMLWPQQPAAAQAYWQQHGLAHALWYAAATLLACIGYGSVFLAAGLLLRNPIIPAAVLLAWENASNFLPAALQKISVLHYVQALYPVPVPVEDGTPALVRLFLSSAEPPTPAVAVAGLLALTALVLWGATRAVRNLEINYSTD
jgi:ABC-type transport system involved in multi-copper enzyme maturation permease subunit